MSVPEEKANVVIDEKRRENEPFEVRHQSIVYRGEQESELRNNEIETEQNVDLRLV